MSKKRVMILGGGTVSHIRSHLALAAPAYGTTAREIDRLCVAHSDKLWVYDYYTRMAGGGRYPGVGYIETNEDVEKWVDRVVEDIGVKIVFFNVAMVDFDGFLDGTKTGKYEKRLTSEQYISSPGYTVTIKPKAKIIRKIREKRKDIFLVGFKTTTNSTRHEQYLSGLKLLKTASCNLVLANDVVTRMNMVITPEEAAYHETTDRTDALKGLVEMAYLRSHLTFTRSTVVAGVPIDWSSPQVPQSLRTVVDYCIERGAYKPFNGATVGHFACKINEDTFLTSRRKTNFNDLKRQGLVLIKTSGPDSVVAYGSKPSVGGQSQRIVFHDHREYDCIVHFHCPIQESSMYAIKRVSQREFECGSHECGQNTSNGLTKFGNLSAVFLENHGPNIVFHHSIDPKEVINFIEMNFDLGGKTGGYMVD